MLRPVRVQNTKVFSILLRSHVDNYISCLNIQTLANNAKKRCRALINCFLLFIYLGETLSYSTLQCICQHAFKIIVTHPIKLMLHFSNLLPWLKYVCCLITGANLQTNPSFLFMGFCKADTCLMLWKISYILDQKEIPQKSTLY